MLSCLSESLGLCPYTTPLFLVRMNKHNTSFSLVSVLKLFWVDTDRLRH